jgi:hypothetical protein
MQGLAGPVPSSPWTSALATLDADEGRVLVRHLTEIRRNLHA